MKNAKSLTKQENFQLELKAMLLKYQAKLTIVNYGKRDNRLVVEFA